MSLETERVARERDLPAPSAPPAPPEKDAPQPPDAESGREMGFIDHLEELRWRLLKGVSSLVVTSALCGAYADFIVTDILIAPLKRSSPTIKLQNLVPYGQVSLYLQAVVFSALILSFPVLVYQLWRFIMPGLLPKERQAARFAVAFISICFFLGVAFGYFIFLPISLSFFANFGSAEIENNIAITDYISFFVGAIFTAGIVFELPVVAYVLSKIGFLTPAFMRHYRRHAIVVSLVVAAIVTPSTDAVTMLVIAVPIIVLYEISIGISAFVNRNNPALK